VIRTSDWKYAARLEGKEEGLYDPKADSGELVNGG
jgi:hypothetical protein